MPIQRMYGNYGQLERMARESGAAEGRYAEGQQAAELQGRMAVEAARGEREAGMEGLRQQGRLDLEDLRAQRMLNHTMLQEAIRQQPKDEQAASMYDFFASLDDQTVENAFGWNDENDRGGQRRGFVRTVRKAVMDRGVRFAPVIWKDFWRRVQSETTGADLARERFEVQQQQRQEDLAIRETDKQAKADETARLEQKRADETARKDYETEHKRLAVLSEAADEELAKIEATKPQEPQEPTRLEGNPKEDALKRYYKAMEKWNTAMEPWNTAMEKWNKEKAAAIAVKAFREKKLTDHAGKATTRPATTGQPGVPGPSGAATVAGSAESVANAGAAGARMRTGAAGKVPAPDGTVIVNNLTGEEFVMQGGQWKAVQK